MKKFLFTTLMSNDLGLLTRSLPIARELRDRGHHVAFCNPRPAPAKLISDAGFDNLPVPFHGPPPFGSTPRESGISMTSRMRRGCGMRTLCGMMSLC
jgi:UDP:flavonoid glycosyltransferase YjiC (YdhE family)